MTQSQQLVIPEPDSFGFRVNVRTPLAHLVAVLRRENPRAPYAQIKLAAEQLRLGTHKVSREPRPDRFDSGTAGAADNSAPVSSSVPAAVAAEPDPARLDEIANGKAPRAEVVAWAQAQSPPLQVPPKGFLPAAVIVAYRAAMRDEYMASLVPVEGGAPMPAEVPPHETY